MSGDPPKQFSDELFFLCCWPELDFSRAECRNRDVHASRYDLDLRELSSKTKRQYESMIKYTKYSLSMFHPVLTIRCVSSEKDKIFGV